jgi:broad specificity phosphatase PhoE
MAFGHWEGLTFAETQQRHPAVLAAWQDDPMHIAPPGGETLLQVADRVNAVLQQIVTVCQAQTVVLVAHGGPLRVLLCLGLGLPARAHWQFVVTPGSLSELSLSDQGAILTRLNVTPHLDEVVHGRLIRE